jgi:hypothetical protein
VNYVVAIIGAVVVLVIMIELLRRRQLSEKYAALWLIVGIGVLILLVAPGLLRVVSQALGFEVPANLLFLVAVTLLLAVTVHLSWELSRLEEETRALAEDLALLRHRVEELESAESSTATIGDEPGSSRDGPA